MKWPLRNSGATYLRNVTDTVQTVQYSDSQCEQQQYWHKRRRCSWLHAVLYCIAPRPFTRFVFYHFRLSSPKTSVTSSIKLDVQEEIVDNSAELSMIECGLAVVIETVENDSEEIVTITVSFVSSVRNIDEDMKVAMEEDIEEDLLRTTLL